MTSLQGSMIAIHGKPKVGKTQLAASFPKPVYFFATEPGHKYIKGIKGIFVKPIQRDEWEAFREKVSSFEEKKVKPKTVVVDTITGLYVACMAYVCKKNGWQHPSDAPHGKGWNALSREFGEGLNDLSWFCEKHNTSLILIDHTKMEEVKTENLEYTKYACSMPGQARTIVLPVPDHIWYLGYEQETEGKKIYSPSGSETRILYISGSDNVEAGTRDPAITRKFIELKKTNQYQQIETALNSEVK